MSIQKGVFNRDFTGYVIKVTDKDKDGRAVKGIMVYDNQRQIDKLNLITAKEGEMYTEPKDNLFIMKMFNGHQYQEMNPQGSNEGRYPFVRMNFKEYTKVFDMSQFDFNRTDENLYKSHQSMLSIRQLKVAVDSINSRLDRAVDDMNSGLMSSINSKYATTGYSAFNDRRESVDHQYFPKRDTQSMEKLKRERLGIIPINHKEKIHLLR